jgi:hypothetical protein
MLLAGNINIARLRFFSPYFIQVPVPQGLIPAGMINAFPRITTAIQLSLLIIKRRELSSAGGTVRGTGMKRVNSGSVDFFKSSPS